MRRKHDDLIPNEVRVMTYLQSTPHESVAGIQDSLGSGMSASVVWRTVNRLTERGLLAFAWDIPTGRDDYRPHRRFWVTDAGEARLSNREERGGACAPQK